MAFIRDLVRSYPRAKVCTMKRAQKFRHLQRQPSREIAFAGRKVRVVGAAPVAARLIPFRAEYALSSRAFRQGTCAPRRYGGQARYLKRYDSLTFNLAHLHIGA